MVAFTKPSVDSKKIRPDLNLLMDFEADQPDQSDSQSNESPSSPYAQVANMSELNLGGKVNKLYDYDKELKLLSQFSGDVLDQPEKDNASENKIRTALLNYQNSHLTPKQIDEVHDNQATARKVSGILGSMNNVFFTNGKQYTLGDSPSQMFKDIGDKWVDSAGAPLKKAEIMQGQYLKDAANAKTLSDVERGNLTARGKDIDNFATANKQIMATVDAKQKDDPNSDVSKKARELLISHLRQAQEYAKLPEGMGGEKRARYRELAPFYDKMEKAVTGASYNDAMHITNVINGVDKETGRRVGEDIKEMGAQLQAEKLGAMLGQNDFTKRKALVETAASVVNEQDALNTMLRIYELSADPEVQKGFGSTTMSKILEMSRNGMTPKQAEYQQLISRANSQEIKNLMGVSSNGEERDRAQQMFINPNDSPTALAGKIPTARRVIGKAMKNMFDKHYGLATGRNFSTDYGIRYDPDTREFPLEDLIKMRNLSPYDMLTSSGGGTVGVTASRTNRGGKVAPESAPKIIKSSDIDFMAERTGKTREQVIKEARSRGYTIQ
jgi:hypothetical protein